MQMLLMANILATFDQMLRKAVISMLPHYFIKSRDLIMLIIISTALHNCSSLGSFIKARQTNNNNL